MLALDNIYHVIDEGSSKLLISLDLALHSTPSTTPFFLVAYKPASTYLDLPLHGSTPILRGAVNLSVLAVPHLQLLCAPRAFSKDLSLVLCFFLIHLTHCTYCQFIWPPAAAVRRRHSAVCRHIQRELRYSSCQTRALSLDPPYLVLLQRVSTESRQIWGNRVWHYPALTFSFNYLYCQWLRNPCSGSQSGQDSWRYPWQ